MDKTEDFKSETIHRRFLTRRSRPRRIISDNGTNVVGALPIFIEIIDGPKVQRAVNLRYCTLPFLMPKGPWQNGFTESMIGIVKTCERETFHKAGIEKNYCRNRIQRKITD